MSTNTKNKKTSGKRVALWVIIALLAVILAASLLIWWALDYAEGLEEPAVPTVPAAEATEPAETTPLVEKIELDTVEFSPVTLDHGLQITDIGKYTGVYMEDGSNEVVSGVLMIVVKNTGEQDIQYAQITLPTDSGEAEFTLSTLPVGESCVLLEQTRLEYVGNEAAFLAEAFNVAVFSEPMSLQEDKLQLQVLDGALNVINISGEDITGDVVIYYKNAAADVYYGGITYRVRIEGGIKADEIKQIMASHFSDSGSKVMFVTVG